MPPSEKGVRGIARLILSLRDHRPSRRARRGNLHVHGAHHPAGWWVALRSTHPTLSYLTYLFRAKDTWLIAWSTAAKELSPSTE